MPLTLGVRVGLLGPALELPKNWWTQQKVCGLLNELHDPELHDLTTSVLSRIYTGHGPDRFENSREPTRIIDTLVNFLAEHLTKDRPNFWKERNLSPEEFKSGLSGTTSEFLHFLSKAAADFGGHANDGSTSLRHQLPIPPSLLIIPRKDAELMHNRLGGNCFFYRLGWELREKKDKHSRGMEAIPMLRRIPAHLDDELKQNFLRYQDSYSQYHEFPEDDRADGFAFYMKNHFAILAQDADPKGVSELFLLHLKDKPMKHSSGDIFEGLIVMNGDLGGPTSCKVLFRRAPENLQGKPWESFAAEYQIKRELDFDAADKLVLTENPDEQEEYSKVPYRYYIERLMFDADVSFDVSLKNNR